MKKLSALFCISLLFFVSCISFTIKESSPRYWKSGSIVSGDVYALYSYSHGATAEEALSGAVNSALKRVEKALDISFKDTERDDVIKRSFNSRYSVYVSRKEFIEQSDGVECYVLISVKLDFSNPRHRKFASEFREHSKKLSANYNQAIEQFRNYEDTRAVNSLISCAYYSDRFDVNLSNMCSRDFVKRAENILRGISIFLAESDGVKSRLRVCRRQGRSLVPISMAGINASFESGSSYSYEFFSDAEGYVDTLPYFYDLFESGLVRFTLLCDDREIVEANFSDKGVVNSFFSLLDSYSIQVYFEGNVIDDKIGFITSFHDTKGNELSTKTYDLQFMSLCSNFKDLSKVDIPIPTLQSIDDIFSDKSLKGFKFIIATQSVIDSVTVQDDYTTIHMEGELYILDNQSRKILYKSTNIETVAKGTTHELAMQAAVNDHYQKITKVCRNILFSNSLLLTKF